MLEPSVPVLTRVKAQIGNMTGTAVPDINNCVTLAMPSDANLLNLTFYADQPGSTAVRVYEPNKTAAVASGTGSVTLKNLAFGRAKQNMTLLVETNAPSMAKHNITFTVTLLHG